MKLNILKYLVIIPVSICITAAAGASYTNNSAMAVKTASGRISKVSISNQNEMQPGLTICVYDGYQNDHICLWRKLNTFNYEPFLAVANMAVMSNKTVEIKANVAGALDSITVINPL